VILKTIEVVVVVDPIIQLDDRSTNDPGRTCVDDSLDIFFIPRIAVGFAAKSHVPKQIARAM
jgi:hypothetical protein